MNPAARTVVCPLPGNRGQAEDDIAVDDRAEWLACPEELVASQIAENRRKVVVEKVVEGAERRPATFLPPSLIGSLQGGLQLAALFYAHPCKGLGCLIDCVSQFDDCSGDGAWAVVFQGERVVRSARGPQVEELAPGKLREAGVVP